MRRSGGKALAAHTVWFGICICVTFLNRLFKLCSFLKFMRAVMPRDEMSRQDGGSCIGSDGESS